VGKLGKDEISATLNHINESNEYVFNNIDIIARNMLLNEYPGCDIEPIMKETINISKMLLYDFKKTTLLLDFGLKPENDSTGTCTWTEDAIKTAYSDFYGLWIPILAGSGTVGASQYCLSDPCPHNDNYGLLDTYSNEKPYTSSWFKEGCGRYYYYAEGLSLTTFSMYDTNYSMCDPSKMMAMLQSLQCDIGKQTLKNK
jgi:hypothetical protein